MLDDAVFRKNLTRGAGKSLADRIGAVRDPALIPGYREKPTATDSDPPLEEPQVEEKPAEELPAEEPTEERAPPDIVAALRELTGEVRLLRLQLESRVNEAACYPNERPPGHVAVSEDKRVSEAEPDVPSKNKKPVKNRALSIISSVLFYAVIVAMVLGAFLMRSTSKGEPFMIAGFSAANVLTGSMEDVYPRGSLIVTKKVDAKELKIGDDITFMVSENSSITHRIIGITENYQGDRRPCLPDPGHQERQPGQGAGGRCQRGWQSRFPQQGPR